MLRTATCLVFCACIVASCTQDADQKATLAEVASARPVASAPSSTADDDQTAAPSAGQSSTPDSDVVAYAPPTLQDENAKIALSNVDVCARGRIKVALMAGERSRKKIVEYLLPDCTRQLVGLGLMDQDRANTFASARAYALIDDVAHGE